MAINPSSMRPVEVARLLNSTEQGFVLPQARIYREFNRGGFRIGSNTDSKSINLVKYIAWLVDEHNAPPAESGVRTYDDIREAARNRSAEQSLTGRDIGDLPEVTDLERKKACERDFKLFCETYENRNCRSLRRTVRFGHAERFGKE